MNGRSARTASISGNGSRRKRERMKANQTCPKCGQGPLVKGAGTDPKYRRSICLDCRHWERVEPFEGDQEQCGCPRCRAARRGAMRETRSRPTKCAVCGRHSIAAETSEDETCVACALRKGKEDETRKALREFGDHKWRCTIHKAIRLSEHVAGVECSCGWRDCIERLGLNE